MDSQECQIIPGRSGMVPLQLDLVRQGDFLIEAGSRLTEMQGKFADYIKEHGSKAKGAKAKLTMEITLVAQAVDGGAVIIVVDASKMALPAPPAKITTAVLWEDSEGDPNLFVQSGGSHRGAPQQKIMQEGGAPIGQ